MSFQAICPFLTELFVVLIFSWTRSKAAFVSLGIGPWWQIHYFPLVTARELQPQTCQRNTLVHFSLLYNNSFGPVFEFSEINRLMALLVGKSSDSTISPNHSKNRYGSQHSQNTLLTSFLKHGMVGPRSVFIPLWNCRETYLCELGNWGLI